MKRRTKTIFFAVWGLIFLMGAYIIFFGAKNFSAQTHRALENVKKDIKQSVAGAFYKMGVRLVVPAVAYAAEDPDGFEKSMAKLLQMYGCLHPFSYGLAFDTSAQGCLEIEETGDVITADTEELSKEQAIMLEAADENHVTGEGDVINSEESMRQAKELISSNMTNSFDTAAEPEDTEPQVVEASAAVEGGAIEQKEITGISYSADMLNYDFLINHFYTVDSTTGITAEKLDASKLLAKDMTLKGDGQGPVILIYHTHSQEGFVDSVAGDSSTTIVGVGDYLTKLLSEKYGFSVLHDTTCYDIVNGEIDRNKAYSLACASVSKILKENPGIEVVIDLHRDGVDGTKLVTNIDGKQMAKIMFFNGLSYTNKNGSISHLENPYIEDNLAFSLKLQIEAAKYYPGLTRKIYLKGYRYNLHLRPKALLVEAGAQNNTLQEELNAMEPLADILARVLTGQE